MIKINLLPQRRAKKRASSPDESTRPLIIGVAGLAAAAGVVILLVDLPKRSKLSDLTASNQQLQGEIQAKTRQLEGYAELKKASDEAEERYKSILRLLSTKVVPAHVLHELGEILTANHLPTMTEEMARKTGTGTDSDPNKRFDFAWDPAHVWLTSISDQADGGFRLEGGAQTEVDITQLSKRLAASAYFTDIAPASETRESDKESGIDYFKFTITGKVAY